MCGGGGGVSSAPGWRGWGAPVYLGGGDCYVGECNVWVMYSAVVPVLFHYIILRTYIICIIVYSTCYMQYNIMCACLRPCLCFCFRFCRILQEEVFKEAKVSVSSCNE